MKLIEEGNDFFKSIQVIDKKMGKKNLEFEMAEWLGYYIAIHYWYLEKVVS